MTPRAKIKTDDQGRVSRFKSRLVARGFLSRDGIEHDEDELYSPVLAMDSLRTIAAIAAGKGYKMCQCDQTRTCRGTSRTATATHDTSTFTTP